MPGMKQIEYTSDRIKWSQYLYDLPQFIQLTSASHLNTHWLPMIFPLPDVCESIGSVVRGFIGHFQAGEDSRSTEEGVGQKSGPRI